MFAGVKDCSNDE